MSEIDLVVHLEKASVEELASKLAPLCTAQARIQFAPNGREPVLVRVSY
jgi:hypothetical protein